ncbi:MAG TPA: HAMP domain-containing sensor histidine kinase [Gemmatimonadaceae bacterium]|nr:HAMP domain-containing sensor histidine kinase [Gemmatimonadaceae bacterium]
MERCDDAVVPVPEDATEGRQTIALLTPTGRDGDIAARVLADSGLHATACVDMPALCAQLTGDVGALVIAEEALSASATEMLLGVLDAQPPWSDVPVMVLTGEEELSRSIPRALEALSDRANVTLIERPVRVATIVTMLRSALRARRRQYDLRDHLEERKRLLASEQAARGQAEEAAARADEANRAKSEFLAVMSHELRTPLNAIGGYVELMELGIRGPITEDQRLDLARIRKSEQHLLGLINGVLNYSRIEAGAVRYSLSDVNVDEVLTTCEALVAPQVRAKKLQFRYAGCDPALAVKADAEKLQQIVLNLLTNAVKFTPSGGRIELDGAAADHEVHIRVRDTGRGIVADQLAHVFEPFVQVDSQLTRTQEGVGLGLAISRDLARGMGGDLTAESTPGAGSEFTLTLPLAEG